MHAYQVPAGTSSGASLIDTTTANKTAANDAPANADAVKKLTDRANRVSVSVVSSGNGTAKSKVALNGDSLAAAGAPKASKASPSPTPTASVSPTPGASASPSAGQAAAAAVALALAAVVTLFLTPSRSR